MDAIRASWLASSARDVGFSARQIVQQHQCSIHSLARPTFRRLFWGPTWFVGEAPKRSHVAACQSFSRLARVWDCLQLNTPVDFRDLTSQPMPKSHSRWGDVRPRDIDAAIGARRILREALGLSGTVTSDLLMVLLGSTVREAFGAEHLDLYRWYRLPRCESVRGELFLASIPHPSPLASQVFDGSQVVRLLEPLRYALARRPRRAVRDARRIRELPLMPLEP